MLLSFVGYTILTFYSRNLVVPRLTKGLLLKRRPLRRQSSKVFLCGKERHDKLPTMYWLPNTQETVSMLFLNFLSYCCQISIKILASCLVNGSLDGSLGPVRPFTIFGPCILDHNTP